MDENDSNINFTALRETQEELGIDSERCEIWGHLRPLPTSVSLRFQLGLHRMPCFEKKNA